MTKDKGAIHINIKCALCGRILNEKPKWKGTDAYHSHCYGA